MGKIISFFRYLLIIIHSSLAMFFWIGCSGKIYYTIQRFLVDIIGDTLGCGLLEVAFYIIIIAWVILNIYSYRKIIVKSNKSRIKRMMLMLTISHIIPAIGIVIGMMFFWYESDFEALAAIIVIFVYAVIYIIMTPIYLLFVYRCKKEKTTNTECEHIEEN